MDDAGMPAATREDVESDGSYFIVSCEVPSEDGPFGPIPAVRMEKRVALPVLVGVLRERLKEET